VEKRSSGGCRRREGVADSRIRYWLGMGTFFQEARNVVSLSVVE